MEDNNQPTSSKQGVESKPNAFSTNSNKCLKGKKRAISIMQRNKRPYDDGTNDIQVTKHNKEIKVDATECLDVIAKLEDDQYPVPGELENSRELSDGVVSEVQNTIKSECNLEMKVVTDEIDLSPESTQISGQIHTLFDVKDSDVDIEILSSASLAKVNRTELQPEPDRGDVATAESPSTHDDSTVKMTPRMNEMKQVKIVLQRLDPSVLAKYQIRTTDPHDNHIPGPIATSFSTQTNSVKINTDRYILGVRKQREKREKMAASNASIKISEKKLKPKSIQETNKLIVKAKDEQIRAPKQSILEKNPELSPFLVSDMDSLAFTKGPTIEETVVGPPAITYGASRGSHSGGSSHKHNNQLGNGLCSLPVTSASNDTERQTSSVDSNSANSRLTVSSTAAGGIKNDGHPATIYFEALAELTSTNLDTGHVSTSDTGCKSYTSIINSESSLNQMWLRTLHEPSIHNNKSPSSSSANSTLGATSQRRGMLTQPPLKKMPSLVLVSAAAIPPIVPTSHPFLDNASKESSSSFIKTPSKDSSKQDNKIDFGGDPLDITEDVTRESPKLSTCQNPRTAMTNSSGETQGSNSSITGSHLGALVTTGGSRNNREKPIDTPPVANQSSTVAPETHSHSAVDSSTSSSSSLTKCSSDFVSEQVGGQEKGSTLDNYGSGDDSIVRDNQVPRNKKKRSPIIIYDHITVLGGQPPIYQCNVCHKKFKTKKTMKYHKFCQTEDEKPFKCERCGQGFIAKGNLKSHLRTHTGERPFVCPTCGKGFKQRGNLTEHMCLHTMEKPFACTQCNKRFTRMASLKNHVVTHTGERPFICNHCGKNFGFKRALKAHMRTHSSPSERPYVCDQCSKAFSNRGDLRRHLVVHLAERPFKCSICGTAFRRKGDLESHIKSRHRQPKEVARKLANEAAAEYIKQKTKNQSLGNVRVSKVQSIDIGISKGEQQELEPLNRRQEEKAGDHDKNGVSVGSGRIELKEVKIILQRLKPSQLTKYGISSTNNEAVNIQQPLSAYNKQKASLNSVDSKNVSYEPCLSGTRNGEEEELALLSTQEINATQDCLKQISVLNNSCQIDNNEQLYSASAPVFTVEELDGAEMEEYYEQHDSYIR